MDATMTRRAFAALSGAAGAASLAQATFGQSSASAAALDEKDSGDISPIEPLEAPQAWDEEFDVVVVGTGGGLAGAVRAAELGASLARRQDARYRRCKQRGERLGGQRFPAAA